MSQGRPTKLVRDGGTESYDPPPDLPLPGELGPACDNSGAVPGEPGVPGSGGDDQEPGYSDWRASRAALDAISGGAIVDEPGGEW